MTSNRTSGAILTVAALSLCAVPAMADHNKNKRSDTHVRAPYTKVDVDKSVRVKAPYTKVKVSKRRVKVRAPYVNLNITW